jgi:hypothetical protein
MECFTSRSDLLVNARKVWCRYSTRPGAENMALNELFSLDCFGDVPSKPTTEVEWQRTLELRNHVNFLDVRRLVTL